MEDRMADFKRKQSGGAPGAAPGGMPSGDAACMKTETTAHAGSRRPAPDPLPARVPPPQPQPVSPPAGPGSGPGRPVRPLAGEIPPQQQHQLQQQLQQQQQLAQGAGRNPSGPFPLQTGPDGMRPMPQEYGNPAPGVSSASGGPSGPLMHQHASGAGAGRQGYPPHGGPGSYADQAYAYQDMRGASGAAGQPQQSRDGQMPGQVPQAPPRQASGQSGPTAPNSFIYGTSSSANKSAFVPAFQQGGPEHQNQAQPGQGSRFLPPDASSGGRSWQR
jgi:hypothetical protein